MTATQFANRQTWLNGNMTPSAVSQNIQNLRQQLMKSNNINSPYNVLDYGIIGDNKTDNTISFQSLINNVPVGSRIYFPTGNYFITDSIIMNTNRITIEGESNSETNLIFLPKANNKIMFYGTGNLDTVTYKNFSVTMGNASSFSGAIAFNHPAGDTRIHWDNVFITYFNRFGIAIGAGNPYYVIRNCRFQLIRDLTSSVIPIAIQSDGTNALTIINNRFLQNDRDITISAGTNIIVRGNTFESGATNGNTLIDYNIYFNNIKVLDYSDNYHEANFTETTASVLHLNDCVVPVVRGNYFNGQDGAVDKSDQFIQITGSNTRKPLIENNIFLEVINYFIQTNQPLSLRGNYYFDGGVELTDVNKISLRMNGFNLMQPDLHYNLYL